MPARSELPPIYAVFQKVLSLQTRHHFMADLGDFYHLLTLGMHQGATDASGVISVDYLGVIISEGHVAMDPVKVEGVLQWPIPTKVKEVRSFIGFCNFYQRCIQDFSAIAHPLFNLTQKSHDWNWDTVCQQAFQTLQKVYTSAPMLVMPDTARPFRVECDTSDYATGAVLLQLEDDGLWHPVAYLSKSLGDAKHNYNIYNKELLAIICGLGAWQHYLECCHHPIDIWTDQCNLKYFKTAQKLSCRQARWAQFLTRFEFTLTHKPGKTNKSDGLSRRPDHKQGVDQDNIDCNLLPGHLFNNPLPGCNLALTEDPAIAQQVQAATAHLIHSHLLDGVQLNGNPDLRKCIKNSTQLNKVVVMPLDTIKKQKFTFQKTQSYGGKWSNHATSPPPSMATLDDTRH